MNFIDLSCDYGVCLWIKGQALSPKHLPIPKDLCKDIEAFEEDYTHNALNGSDDWWERHFDKELEIAKKLQEVLPNNTIRLWYYGQWVELAKCLYQIEIIEGFQSGGNFQISVSDRAEGLYGKYEGIREMTEGITLDDTFAFPYIWCFLKDIPFDDELQNRENSKKMGFNTWGVNYYTYKSINYLLGELTQAIYLLQENFNSPKLSKLKEYLRYNFDYSFLRKFYPKLAWELLSEIEKDIFIQKHHYIISNFYSRFIQKMRKMMNDNPRCHLVYFAGP